MTKHLAQTADNDVADHIGGGMASAAFENWITSNPTRRSTGSVVRGGRRLFDPRLARVQMLADIARWRSTVQRPAAAERPPIGRFFRRPRKRAKRTAASSTASADPDGEHEAAPSAANGGES